MAGTDDQDTDDQDTDDQDAEDQDAEDQGTDDQGTQYAAFIEAELKAENDRWASVNSRASSLLTGATTLVTLSLAVFAVFIGKDFTLWGWAKAFLGAALIALFFAGLFSVLAQTPGAMEAPSATGLEMFLRKHEETEDPRAPGWKNTEADARYYTAKENLARFESLRSVTNKKNLPAYVRTMA